MARAGRFENDSAVFATQVGRVLTELERDMTFRFPAYKALIAITTGHSPILADELNLIRNTSREELAAAMAPIYQPHNAVIVVAGNLNMDSTRALLSETAQRLKLNDPHKPSAQTVITPTLRFNQSGIIEHQNRTGHYVVAIGWSKPKLGDPDQLAELVADELLLGHGPGVADPARSDSSAAALRLAQSLGGSAFWDGRAGTWAAPDLVDTGPNIHAIVFTTDRNLTAKDVRDSVSNALRDIQRNGASDEAINAVKENLASFYERWFFEPTYRVLADHLMAFAATGRDPNDVKLIPSMIRQVKPSEVRAALKRYFVDAPSNVVILPPEPTAK
jgi:predicted Zn-dependent peptidase